MSDDIDVSNINFTELSSTKSLFLQLASSKPTLSAALNDPLVDLMASFAAQLSVAAHHRADRVEQERFLMTANNRSSILAKSEDRQYNPRKPLPSTGTLEVTTKDGNSPEGAVAETQLLSAGSIPYLTAGRPVLDNGVWIAPVKQVEIKQITDTVVEVEKDFYEVIIPKEYTARITGIYVSVNVDPISSTGFEAFKLSRRLRLAEADEKVYDEFYTNDDSFGVRFGTGVKGLMLPKGAIVRLTLHLTLGETTLIPGEKLRSITDSRYVFAVKTAITGGAPQEDLESIRKNSLYSEIYDLEHVWGGDFEFFLHQNFPNLTWVNVWGEAEQEKIEGHESQDFINKIYISAYDGQEDINARIQEALQVVPQLNKEYSIVDPDEGAFTIDVEGVIQRDWELKSAEEAIETMLFEKYAKGSRNRKSQPFKRDIYEFLRELNIFDTRYDVDVVVPDVNRVPLNKRHFIFLDESAYNLGRSEGNSVSAGDKKIVLRYA